MSLIGALGILLALPISAQGRELSSPRARIVPPAVYQEARAAVARCLNAADAACVQHGFASFASRLVPEIDALPAGRAGLAAWLRFAARLHRGSIPTAPAVRPIPLRVALETLYTEVGYEPDAGDRTRIDEQLARLSRAESDEIAGLVSAFDLSLRLAARARGDSGIERWMDDPRRLHLLATQAIRAPDQAPPEAHELLDALTRVDMETMTQASLVMADALAQLDASMLQHTIDLPLVFVGGRGNTVHTEDRLVLIDRSGSDTYLNNAGGGLVRLRRGPERPLGGSFAADLGGGDDFYDHEIALGEGADGAQGYAAGGVGILYDEGGSDHYRLGVGFGHGAGDAGVGVLYDVGNGGDHYLTTWEAGELIPVATNGSSGAGIGLLIDEGGSDVFRQDGVDGIAWAAAGGLGVLASLGPGDDTVRSDAEGDSFTGVVQGNAELQGVAILYDERGDDHYLCNGPIRQGCQGVAGGGFGMLWDRAGDDRYFAETPYSCDLFHDCFPRLDLDVVPIDFPLIGPLGQGAAYWTVPPTGLALGVLYDESGNDRYVAPKWAQGYGVLGNLGLLYDAGGKDAYDTRSPLFGTRADGERWIDGVLGMGIDE